ncbi:MAG: DUF5801 repeats-in-toxin domain-containing protein, partial [Pseudomonadota bacterium]
MNGPFQVAQAGTVAGQSAGKLPKHIVRITKPYAEQAVTIALSYDGSVRADVSAIAGEKITLVHVGEKLIILFDNKSTVTLEPYFDATGKPLDGISMEVSPGRDLTGTEFAALFPVTEDQSVLPAAGDGNGNAQASGANFSSVGIDPLAAPNPLDLLGQEELPGLQFTVQLGTSVTAAEIALTASFVLSNTDVVHDETAGIQTLLASDQSGAPPFAAPAGAAPLIGWAQSLLSEIASSTVDFGTHGAGTVAYTLRAADGNVFTGADSGLRATQTGNEIFLFTEGDLVVGREGNGSTPNANGVVAFALFLEPGSLKLDLAQYEAISHPNASDPNDLVGLGDLIHVTQIATAADGTILTTTSAAGLNISFLDDGPGILVTVVQPEEGTAHLATLSLDESIGGDRGANGAPDGTPDDTGNTVPDPTGTNPISEMKTAAGEGNVPGDLQALFNVVRDPGTDGEKSTTYAFTFALTGAGETGGVASTLKVTDPTHIYGDDTIYLFKVSATEIIGHVGNDPNGPIALRITLQDAGSLSGGQLVVDQYMAIDHGPDGSNFDSSQSLHLVGEGAGLGVTLTATITDGDNDTAMSSATIAIAGQQTSSISFQDDGPAIAVTVIQPEEGSAHLATLSLDESISGDRGANGVSDGMLDDTGNTLPDPTGTNPIGELKSTAGDGSKPGDLEALFSVTKIAGTDGEKSTTYAYSLDLTGVGDNGGVASTLKVTDPTHIYGDDTIYLFRVSATEIVGHVGNDPNGPIALRITLQDAGSLSGGQLVVDQYMAIDHGQDGNNFDSSQSLNLVGEGASLGVTLTATITDGDNDTATSSATIAIADGNSSSISFQDDGPAVTVAETAGFQIVHDETLLLQSPPFGDDNDILFTPVFNSVANPGHDPDGVFGLPLGYARSAVSALTVGSVDFGTDGAAATNSKIFTLTLTNQNGDIATGPIDSGIKTTDGHEIFLFVENGLIVGRYDGSDADSTVTNTGNDPAAFAIAINASTGIVSLVQYVSLFHPSADVGGDSDEAVSLANALGSIKATLTVTDGDGDTASASATISGAIQFEDDGPLVTVVVSRNFGVTADESAGLQANDVAGPLAAFADVSSPGDDPDVTGPVLAYATSNGVALTVVPYFGVDGPDPTTPITYSLALNSSVSGVTLTNGSAISLHLESGLIVGRVDTGAFAGDAAFAIAIDPANGKVSVVEYLSLNHPNTANPNDTVSLAAGAVSVVVTIKDGDGDTASASADISGNIHFNDDGPTLIANSSVAANVDEDGLHTPGLSDSNPDNSRPGEVAGTNSAVATGAAGALKALVDFGADGFGSFGLKTITTPVDTGLKSDGGHILVVTDVNGLHGYVDNGTPGYDAGDREIFILTVGADGSYVFTLKDQIDHPTLNNLLGDNTENTQAIDLSSYVVATDGDGDSVPLGAGTFTVTVLDDIPVITARAPEQTTVTTTETVTYTLQAGNTDIRGMDGQNNHDIKLTGIDLKEGDNSVNTTGTKIGVGDGQIIDGYDTHPGLTGPEILTMTFVNNLQITGVPNNPTIMDSGSYDVSSATFSIDVAEAHGVETAVVFVSATNNGAFVALTFTVNGLPFAGATPVFQGGMQVGYVLDGVTDLSTVQAIGATPFDVFNVGNYNNYQFDNTAGGGHETFTDGNSFKVFGIESTITTTTIVTETFKVSEDESAGVNTAADPNPANDVDPLANVPPAAIAEAGAIGYAKSPTSVLAPGALFAGKVGADEPGVYSFAVTDKDGNAISGVDSGLKTLDGSHIMLTTDASGAVVGAVGQTEIFKVYVDSAGYVWIAQYQAIANDLAGSSPAAFDDIATVTADLHIKATLTDFDGDSTSAVSGVALQIQFQDDGPIAVNDIDSANGAALTATGNVITGIDIAVGADANATDGNKDTVGADGAKITEVAGITTITTPDGANNFQVTGQYGTLVINANGDYTYTRFNGSPIVANDVFTYTLTDGDGDFSTAKLTISISDHGVTVSGIGATGGDEAVFEANLPTGSSPNDPLLTQIGTFHFSAPDGVDDLSIGGTLVVQNGVVQNINTPFNTTYGVLTITGVDLLAGTVSYSYTLAHNTLAHGPLSNGGANSVFDSIAVQVTDTDGDAASSSLIVKVVDDVPTAHADTDAAQSGQVTAGNVITDAEANGDNGADKAGADGIASIAWTGVAGSTVTGVHGVLTVDANGGYSYHANPNTSGTDVFHYMITDGDGDTSPSTLTITVANGQPLVAPASATVDEAALDTATNPGDLGAGAVTGSTPSSTAETTTGTLTFSDPDVPVTVTGIAAGNLGTDVSGNVGTTIAGLYGLLKVDSSGHYTYTLTSPFTTTPATDNGVTTEPGKDVFTFTVTDAFNNTSTSTISISIIDDVPHAVAPPTVLNIDEAGLTGFPSVQAQTGFLNINWGADNGVAKQVAFATDGSGHYGPALASGGVTLDYFVTTVTDAANVVHPELVAYKHLGDPNDPVFTITLTTPSGNNNPYYTFALFHPLDEPAAGTDTMPLNFHVTATDADGDTIPVTLTVNVKDDVPTALADTNWAKEDTSDASGNVLQTLAHTGAPAGLFSDHADTQGADGITSVAWTGASLGVVAGVYGALTVGADGSYTYAVNNGNASVQALGVNDTLTEVFNYTVADGDGDTSPATLTITIFGTNDAPSAVADTNWAKEDTSDASGNVLQTLAHTGAPAGLFSDHADTDPDATDTLTVSAVNGAAGNVATAVGGSYGSVTIGINGAYTYTLNNGNASVQALGVNDTLSDSFSYTVTDSHGGTSTATLTITIFGTNDAPSAVA